MSRPGIPTNPAELAYFALLGANAVVFLICLIAGPRVWSRRLGWSFVWLNGLILLAVAVFLAHFAITTGLRDEGGFGFGLAVMITIPVFIEFLWLLALAWFRLRPRRPTHRGHL